MPIADVRAFITVATNNQKSRQRHPLASDIFGLTVAHLALAFSLLKYDCAVGRDQVLKELSLADISLQRYHSSWPGDWKHIVSVTDTGALLPPDSSPNI